MLAQSRLETVWKRFYAFHITEDETVRVQLERFESIVKKLDEIDKKPSEEAIVSKLLSSLSENFELFTVAWECTPKDDQTQKTLIARLINNNACASPKSHVKKKTRSKKDIKELKQRTSCGRGHNSAKAVKGTTALVCDINSSYQCISTESSRDFIADTGAGRPMTFRKEFFSEIRPNSVGSAVKVADNRCIDAPGAVEYVQALECNEFSQARIVFECRVILLGSFSIRAVEFYMSANEEMCSTCPILAVICFLLDQKIKKA
ncbi:hypothetical protein TSAR_013197 [Trichomalopsis sarcophagae]|uniref:Uncharacterized protein n=1 Tax=Trichomalopsis sarcophagae TaxID=543379 RepID=A0A232FCA2_9HYME|nr:hypothetical protein TSAR_013197 [Trichomalopsis sarcophagae]